MATGILTVPERLAAMAFDSSSQIEYTAWTFQKTLDTLIRPAVIVEVDAAEYPAVAASIQMPVETYRLYLIGPKFGTGNDEAESELKVRTITDALLSYFHARPNLSMSNLLGRAPAALPALRGVRWGRMNRGPVNVLTRGEDEFWGCDMTISVEWMMTAMEQLI